MACESTKWGSGEKRKVVKRRKGEREGCGRKKRHEQQAGSRETGREGVRG